MAFDAGTIIAHLEIDQDKADADLRKFEQKVKDFERQGHKVRIGAEFDNPSLAKAKRIFEQLDNQLSRDAMNRLRSSPNGSVLGALNALFSPHQLSGAPTPAQSAQGGMLGRMAGSQGTAQAGTGSVLTSLVKPAGQSGTVNQGVREKLVGPAVGPDGTLTQKVQLKPDNAASQKAADDTARSFSARFSEGISRIFGGGKGGGGALGKAGLGLIGGGTGGQGFLSGLLGGIGPGILGLGLKPTAIAAGGGAALGALPSLLGGLSPLLAAAPGLAGLGVLIKGAISNVQPLTQLANQIQSQQAAGLGSTAAGAKQIAQEQQQLQAGFKALTGPQKSLFTSIQNIQNAWQNLTTSFTPLVAKALGGVAKLFQQILPQLNSFFAASGQLIGPLIGGLGDIAKQLLPLFTAGIKAAVPVLRPLLDGLGSLVAGIFPGLIALVKVSLPAVQALAQVLGGLGKDIGGLFAALAPGIKASAPILKALFDLVGALFPIIGKLASILANALGPVFVAFAGAIKSLLPFLTIIGKVLGSLAAAILGDLVSAFTALAQLLVLVSPSLQILAKALAQVFQVLENSGVFAILGNALEAIVPLLAQLINTIVIGLAPVLPKIIQLVSSLAGDAINVLVAAFKALLPVAIVLVQDALIPLIPVLNALIPVITVVAGLLASGLGAVISAIAPVLKVLAPIILAIVAGLKLWAIAQGILNIALDANPIGLIALAIAGLVIGIIELVKHWSAVWGEIKAIARDAWNFIWNGFGKFLLPLLGPVGLIALGAIELAKHWKMITGDIKSDAHDLWQWLWSDFGAKIFNFFVKTIPGWWDTSIQFLNRNFITPLKNDLVEAWQFLVNNFWNPLKNLVTVTLPGWFNTAVSGVKIAWNAVKGVVEAPIKFVIDTVLDGLISAFDWISSKVGGPSIAQVHPFGLKQGGRIPGYGGGDRFPALLEAGETVIDKDRSQQWGWLFRMMGVPGYAGGGTPGPPDPHGAPHTGPGGLGFLGKITEVGKILAAIFSGNSVALTNAFLGLFGHGVGGAVGDLAGLLTAIPTTLVKDAVHFLIKTFTGSGPGGGTAATSAQVLHWIQEAVAITGAPLNWIPDLGLLVSKESGGNPLAANTTAAGIAAGRPEGIAQVTIGTFAADALPGFTDIWNPVDNLIAGIRHIFSAWGSIFNIPGLSAPGAYQGYKHGGVLPEPVFGWGPSGRAYGLHAGETIIPAGGGSSDVLDVLNDMADSLDQLIAEVRASSSRTGAAMGASLGRAARAAGNAALYQ